jgi:hypothetical protein
MATPERPLKGGVRGGGAPQAEKGGKTPNWDPTGRDEGGGDGGIPQQERKKEEQKRTKKQQQEKAMSKLNFVLIVLQMDDPRDTPEGGNKNAHNRIKKRSKCAQNALRMRSKCAQNALKIRTKR